MQSRLLLPLPGTSGRGQGPGRLYWRANTFIATEGYVMIAYWRDANESGSDITGRFPASSQVLLVPESFPRSPVERALRLTAAAVATPFTAVVDALIWIRFLAFGD